jgi:acetolactate synthase small subunit
MDENKKAQLHIGLFNNDGLFVLDTENKNYLSKCNLVFKGEEINNIEHLFDEIILLFDIDM